MADKVVTEIEVVDGASKAFDDMSRAGADLKSVLQGIGGAAKASTPEAGRAAAAFDKLYKTHVEGASAADRYDRAITKINRALSQNAVASTATATAEERVARLRAALSDQLDASERAIRGNSTAYDKLRNSIDSVSSAERAFAQGAEIVNSALARGELDARRNAAEITRVTAALQDSRRASLQQADAYTQIAERLNPLLKLERDHIAEVDTIRRAQDARRITDEQAEAQIASLRAEVEKQTAEINGSAEADKAAAKAADEATAALEREREAYRALTEELDPATKAQREFNEATARVQAAQARGDVSAPVAARQVTQLASIRDAAIAVPPSDAVQKFEALQSSQNRLIAAERELAEQTQIVNRFLAEHPARANEAAAAQARLEQQFEETKREIAEEQSAFQRLNLSLDSTARAEAEFARDSATVRRALENMEIGAEDAARAMSLLDRRLDEARRSAHGVDRGFGDVGRGVGRLNLAFTAGTAIVTAFFGSFAVRKLIDAVDVMQRAENRLRIVTDSFGELRHVQDALFASSQRSFTSIEGGVEIYERLARSTKNLEISQQRLLAVTETIQKTVALSGTTTLAAEAALIQFGQGLAADSLRGQELNSVMEQTPRLARALAEGLGVSIGALRGLANQGELTAEKVINAIENSAKKVNAEFSTIEPTFKQVSQVAVNSLTVIGDAFAKPIVNEAKREILELQKILDDPKTKEGAIAFGQTLAASLEAAANSPGAKAFAAIVGFLGGAAPKEIARIDALIDRAKTLE